MTEKNNLQHDYSFPGEELASTLKSGLDTLGSDDGRKTAKEIIDLSIGERKFAIRQEKIVKKSSVEKKPSPGPERLRQIAEYKEQDEVRQQLDELYREKHPEEVDQMDADKLHEADRTMMKVFMDARHATKREAIPVKEEAAHVAQFVRQYGVEEIPADRVETSTLVRRNKRGAYLGQAGSIGDGENRFVIMRPGMLEKGTAGKLVLDHEYLHMYQSKDCPIALVEGVTTLFTERMQPNTRRLLTARLLTLMSSYAPDRFCASIYEKVVGKKALGDAYFKGDLEGFMQQYKEKVGSTKSLERQFGLIAKSRGMMSGRGVVMANVMSFPAVGLGAIASGMASFDLLRARMRPNGK